MCWGTRLACSALSNIVITVLISWQDISSASAVSSMNPPYDGAYSKTAGLVLHAFLDSKGGVARSLTPFLLSDREEPSPGNNHCLLQVAAVRDIRVFFSGGLSAKDVSYSHGVRQTMYMLFNNTPGE